MPNYDFTSSLSPIDFELLSKDLLEAELGIQLENFREGGDKGIDLRFSPAMMSHSALLLRNITASGLGQQSPELIVQCKRHATFASLKSELSNKELPKILKLNPARYMLSTSVSLSPQQADELKSILSPFIRSTGDIFGRQRLNSILDKHPEIERRHIKLWIGSAGILNSILNAGIHNVSREEVEHTISAAKVYVRNASFDEALTILKEHHVCIIAGQPGIGKTMLARMLLLYFYEREYEVIKIESDISEARDVGYHNKPRFYYYDDFLGQTGQADKLNKNEDQKLLDFMRSIQDSKDSVFVLTTREYILNQAKLYYEKLNREKFDYRMCIIDLSKYSRRIRAQILYNHLHFSDLPRQHLECFVANRGYVKAVDHKNYNPRLIEYLTSATWVGEIPSMQYLPLFLANLDNPVQIWDHAFRNQLSPQARHLLFVLTTLPRETILEDVEMAFDAFHNQQCNRFGNTRSADDFRRALKECDGTFVAIQKLQESVLISFQNPSIRDFMKNLLLSGELLAEIINSLVFFEQASWFSETLGDPNPQVPLKELVRHTRTIANCLQKLSEAKSCSISAYNYRSQPFVRLQLANQASRLAKCASFVVDFKEERDIQWIIAQITNLAEKIETEKLTSSSCVVAVQPLQVLGLLETKEGKRFVAAMRSSVMKEPSELDEFETLADVIYALPESFAASEVDNIRKMYSAFAEQYATECDLTDPDELRAKASHIEDIGHLLEVDTEGAQEMLRESAHEIEKEDERNQFWDPDDERRPIDTSDHCSDADLDSMFGTLGN